MLEKSKKLLEYLMVICLFILLYCLYDVFIKENIAKSDFAYRSNGLEMKKEVYVTQKMCNYHLGKLYKKLENFALYSDSENIIENIFRNSDIEVYRTSNMSLEFDSYFDFQVRNIDLKESELSRVHIKINNGIVEISYPIIK